MFVERVGKNTSVSICTPTIRSEARSQLARYLVCYNQRRPHLALVGKTPDTVYFDSLPLQQAANPQGQHLENPKNCPTAWDPLGDHERSKSGSVYILERRLVALP